MISKNFVFHIFIICIFISTTTSLAVTGNATGISSDVPSSSGTTTDQAHSEALKSSLPKPSTKALQTALQKLNSNSALVNEIMISKGNKLSLIQPNIQRNTNWLLLKQNGTWMDQPLISWGHKGGLGITDEKFSIQQNAKKFKFKITENYHLEELTSQERASVLNDQENSYQGELVDIYEGYLNKNQEIYVLRTKEEFILVDVKTGQTLEEIPIQKFSSIDTLSEKNITFLELENGAVMAITEMANGVLYIYNEITDSELSTDPIVIKHEIPITDLKPKKTSKTEVVHIERIPIRVNHDKGLDYIQFKSQTGRIYQLVSKKINDFAEVRTPHQDIRVTLWGLTPAQLFDINSVFLHRASMASFTLKLRNSTIGNPSVFDRPFRIAGELVDIFTLGSFFQ